MIGIVAQNWLYFDGGEISFSQGNYTSGTFRVMIFFNFIV